MKHATKPDGKPVNPPTIEEIARDILAELGLKNESDPGATIMELAEEWGVGVSTARRRVDRAKKGGCIIEGRRIIKDTMGRRMYVPVYMPVVRFKRGEE